MSIVSRLVTTIRERERERCREREIYRRARIKEMHSTLYENNNKFNNSYCSMKQYESFVISQGNVQGLRSSAFGLKSNELFNEFKGRGRGRGREGHLHQMAALE